MDKVIKLTYPLLMNQHYPSAFQLEHSACASGSSAVHEIVQTARDSVSITNTRLITSQTEPLSLSVSEISQLSAKSQLKSVIRKASSRAHATPWCHADLADRIVSRHCVLCDF